MNEEEKQAIEFLKHSLYEYEEIDTSVMEYIDKNHKIIYKLILKQQKEIEELKENNNALEIMFDTANEREYRKKYIEERRKEQPNLYLPDFDEIYERYYKQKAEIEQLKKDYQILKDDIEGHNVVYVDTPDFEKKYISKDKIRKEIEEIKNCRLSTCDEQINKSLKERYEIEDEICEYFEELLGE